MSRIDFTPQWYRNELHSARNRRRRMAFVGVIFLLMVSWFVINEGRISSAQAVLRGTEANSQQSQAVLRGTEANSQQSQLLSDRLQSIRNKKQELQRQLAHYEALLNHVPPSVVLAEISHRIPDEASLKDFVLAPLSAKRSSNRKRASRFAIVPGTHDSAPAHCRMMATITAHASGSETMSRFVGKLKESALFAGLGQKGTSSEKVSGIKVKEKTMYLFVLDAECIAP